ncbi:hypothetical protein IFM89_012488 [Coptis chinensis]|uniref:Tetrapyrrole methylase domain-containing protein n=1 Tax=Coptis chinensis TaxID=261450 RepID=A0A835I2Y9_9MAGN|nr:hypothetical protein IFM89_012488 [Coptis chinensis]
MYVLGVVARDYYPSGTLRKVLGEVLEELTKEIPPEDAERLVPVRATVSALKYSRLLRDLPKLPREYSVPATRDVDMFDYLQYTFVVSAVQGIQSRSDKITQRGEIHELLLSFAEVGASVVFGRGGEEMEFLQQQGIQVKVIPGITAASGIAAELGMPLTHRGVSNSIRFLTGHSNSVSFLFFRDFSPFESVRSL